MLSNINRLSLCLAIVLFSSTFMIAQVTCEQVTLVTNGSFDGTIGPSVTAAGWDGDSSPDLNDHLNSVQTTSGYNWVGQPEESFDGGTWQNLFGIESISQTLDLEIGQWYDLRFHYAAQGIVSGGVEFSSPVGVTVSLNGLSVYTAPDDETQYTWEPVNLEFQATEETVVLTFSPTQDEYLGIDGVCLMPISNPMSIADYTSALQLEMYPNPSNSMITISGIEESSARLVVVDTNGRRVEERQLNGEEQIQLTVSTWPAGIYFIQVITDEKRWIDRLVVSP
ncbi:MAG: T9SS type A sorting domain-containing protein [Flavobacteriales bacterium]|nr:T9SS type A sorting domain-containing protein [Flavobacteriales bacterium]MDG2246104.1 T9SS type A sorting domain-containing protein [Flavobacteriales bacterium]